MGIKEKWNKINKAFDVSDQLPKGYLNFKVIRSGWVLILILWFIALGSNGFQLASYYAECPETASSCANPFLENKNNIEIAEFCEEVPSMCEKTVLQGGESIGKKPTFLFKNYDTIAFLLIVAIYGLNHLLWRRKQ